MYNEKFALKYFCFFILVFSSFSGAYAKDSNLTKQEIWDRISDDVDLWVDQLGCPIDSEIKEIVVALNAMGIKTTASCEGHLDHGYAYPWVELEIDSPDFEQLVDDFNTTLKLIEIEESLLEEKYPNLSFLELMDRPEAMELLGLYQQRFLIMKSYDQSKMKSLEFFNTLIDLFYENHKVSYDTTLIFSVEKQRLVNVGAERQIVRSEELQISKLNEYREEMNNFAMFLKMIFLTSN